MLIAHISNSFKPEQQLVVTKLKGESQQSD